ncbi:MAG: DUF1488 family protein [Pseudomonadota bacterium]
MDGNLRINWAALVEEAKQRRKAQGITQKRLAEIANVSTPTVSRFEGGEKDIQLSSALAILTVLGMTDRRTLIFPDSNPRYEDDRNRLAFDGRDGDTTIVCRIGKTALAEHTGFHGNDMMKGFEAHRSVIEHLARRKYLSGQVEADGSVFIDRKDD